MSIGNNYPLWSIGSAGQVQALDPVKNAWISKSNNDFAFDIGISQDGTVWVISTVLDPNGGAKIFWSPGDGTWNEVPKPTKQAAQICGTTSSNCTYISETGDVVQMSTDGTSRLLEVGKNITDIDYGGGYYWAIFATQSGGIPCLQFAPAVAGGLSWQPFAGNPIPTSLSVNYSGNCYAVADFNPMFYSTDGKTSNIDGKGAEGVTLQITFKNTYYILSSNANADGNEILIWVDEEGGIWNQTGLRAINIVSSWYNG